MSDWSGDDGVAVSFEETLTPNILDDDDDDDDSYDDVDDDEEEEDEDVGSSCSLLGGNINTQLADQLRTGCHVAAVGNRMMNIFQELW